MLIDNIVMSGLTVSWTHYANQEKKRAARRLPLDRMLFQPIPYPV